MEFIHDDSRFSMRNILNLQNTDLQEGPLVQNQAMNFNGQHESLTYQSSCDYQYPSNCCLPPPYGFQSPHQGYETNLQNVGYRQDVTIGSKGFYYTFLYFLFIFKKEINLYSI